MPEIKKADLKSMSISEDKLRQLKDVFPEAFAEGLKVDLEKLKIAIGKDAELGKERFGMNWPGKADCFKIIQAPSVATLIPVKDESVNFDVTENLFIEGDNLEVLKLLQKSYYGKVKMIYIDPPYNTGKEFIYPDNYAESLDTYLRYSGQIDDQGRKYSTNAETDGRFHSKWLNMMYPRLYLARNLLSDNGVIFISIDDNEEASLKKVCDEIFGEENFICNFLWKKKSTSTNVEGVQVSALCDYTLVYGKTGLAKLKPRMTPKETRSYPFSDQEGKYRTTVIEKKDAGAYERQTMKFEILGKKPRAGKRWQIGEDTARALEAKNRFLVDEEGKIKLKIYDFEDQDTFSAHPNLLDSHGTTDSAASMVNEKIFGMPELFSNPKPIELLEYFLGIATDTNDFVLDFFSGSCSTAHAVLNYSKGGRKFICIQLPEPIDPDSEEYRVGYKTIADIGKERIRRVIKNIQDEQKDRLDFKQSGLDLGFKVFKLTQSNFKLWEGSVDPKKEVVEKQLVMHVDHINPKSSQEDILFELLLKAGFELTTKIEKISITGKTVYSIEGGLMLICLEKELTKEVIKAMAEKNPSRVICLDQGFEGNDQLKTNAVQIMKSKGVEDFRTV